LLPLLMFSFVHARCASVVVVALALASGTLSASLRPRATVCNGHAELCNKPFGQVTFVGAHDSFAVGSNNLAANQDYDVTQQLNDGIRMLQNQVLQQSDGLHLCHTLCPLYDAGLLVNYLVKVRKWLAQNPNEVVSILLVNINDVPVEKFAEVYNSAGLADVSFVPSAPTLTVDQWPTLGSIIDSGKTLVTFIDNGADASVAPYLIDEFTNMWETAFDVTRNDWPCDVNRTRGDPTTKLYLINHFLDETTNVVGASTIAPAKDQLNLTNAAVGPGSLGQEIDNCMQAHGVPPNFILVDFYEYGGGAPFDVAAQLNGVPAPTIRPAPPIAGSATTTAGNGIITSIPISGAQARGSPRVQLMWTLLVIGMWALAMMM